MLATMPREPQRLKIARPSPRRGTTSQRMYGAAWQRFRDAWFAQEPRFCAHCALRGIVRPANTADHIRPHKGDPVLFWDPANLQALCGTCHSVKTANEDGGFGRPVVEAVPNPPVKLNELFARLRDKALNDGRADVEHAGHDRERESERDDDE